MSRFVSQSELDERSAERQAEWQAMHERLGQPAPPLPEDSQPYDPRSLAEQLAEQRDKKESEFAEKTSLKNQWRGLDEEEVAFLADSAAEQREAERQRKLEVDAELQRYREAISSKPAASPPIITSSAATKAAAAPAPEPATKPKGKKGQRNFLAGVIKPKAVSKASRSADAEPASEVTAKRTADELVHAAKRPKSEV